MMDRTKSWRTLILARIQYPPMGGEYLRNWQTINILRQLGAVTVFSLLERDMDPPALEGIDAWHHYNTTADHSIRSRLEHIAQWLNQAGLTYYCPYRTNIAQALANAIASFQPNLVILEQLWMIPYLPVIQRYPCQVIYDAHNIEMPLYQSTKCAGMGPRSHLRQWLHIPQIRSSEQKLLQKTDQVWICSEADRISLQQVYGANQRVFTIPNGLDLRGYERTRAEQKRMPLDREKSQHNILFLGNFAHIPNAEAAHTLISEIYPPLKAIYPQCRLLLVGRHPTPAMLAAAQWDPEILVTGEVEDVKPFLAIARTMVVPLTQGSGTRLKILEAFAAHCPVVSTSKGAEGLDVQDGKHLLIGNGSAEMIQGILEIWENPELAAQLTHRAFQLMKAQYSWESVSDKVKQALQEL